MAVPSVHERRRRLRVRRPRTGEPNRGADGTGSRPLASWSTRTDSSVPPTHATSGANRR